MVMHPSTIDQLTLKRLVEAGSVVGTSIVGRPNGWEVAVKYGVAESYIEAQRGTVRTFRKLETLVGYLKDIGISQFSVNTSGYDVAHYKASRVRPDASLRMKVAFEAKANDDWMQSRVTESFDDPRPSVSHAEAMLMVQKAIDEVEPKHATATSS